MACGFGETPGTILPPQRGYMVGTSGGGEHDYPVWYWTGSTPSMHGRMHVPIGTDMRMHPVNVDDGNDFVREIKSWHEFPDLLVCLSKPTRRDAWLKCSSPTLPCHAKTLSGCCGICRRILIISLCPRGRPATLHPNRSATEHTGVRKSSTKP